MFNLIIKNNVKRRSQLFIAIFTVFRSHFYRIIFWKKKLKLNLARKILIHFRGSGR